MPRSSREICLATHRGRWASWELQARITAPAVVDDDPRHHAVEVGQRDSLGITFGGELILDDKRAVPLVLDNKNQVTCHARAPDGQVGAVVTIEIAGGKIV